MTDPNETVPAGRDQPAAIWVVSEPDPDGTFVCNVHVTADVTFTLTRSQARLYAAVVHAAATVAEYEAAVLAQLLDTGMPVTTATSGLAMMREGRTPRFWPPGPLRYTPIVSGRTRAGMVDVALDGRVISQWTPADCRQHAGHVLDVVVAVDLDATYRQFLVGIGLDDNRARATVEGLARFITPQPPTVPEDPDGR